MDKEDRSLGEAINELKYKIAELSDFIEIYNAMAQNSIMFTLDHKGNFVSLQKGDSPVHKLEGKSFLSVLDKGDKKKAAENFMKCLEGKKVNTSIKAGEKTFDIIAVPKKRENKVEGVHGIAVEKSSKSSFERIFDAIGEAMAISDLLGNITVANHSLNSLLGYENVKNKNIFDFVDGENVQDVRDDIREALSGERRRREIYVVNREGIKIPVEVEISGIEDEGLLFLMRELTHKKVMENEIKEISEEKDAHINKFKEKISEIYDAANKSSVQDLYDGTIRTIIKLFDVDSCFIGLISDGELNVVAYHGEKPSEDISVDEVVSVAVSKDGIYEIYGEEENYVYAALTEDKEVVGVIGMKTDKELSDDSRCLLKLLSQNAAKSIVYLNSKYALRRCRETIDRAVEGIYRTTFDGKIIEVNPAFAKIFGYEGREKELKKINAEDLFFKADDRKKFLKALEKEGMVRHFETKYVTRDNTVIFGRESAWIAHENGEKIIEGIFQDITQQRKIEEDARFYNSLLRHDIYNKNEIAIGYLGLLKNSDLSEKDMEIVTKAVRAITEGNKLIEAVKKLEIINDKKEMSDIAIDDVMEQVISHYSEEAKKRDIEVAYKPSGAVVRGNELVEDVFSNLIKNSIEHSYAQHITIYAKDCDDGWNIYIEDDGVGIPSDAKNKVFQQGWKGKGSTGSGLGLYLVKKIVDGLGGRIWVESGEDEYPEGCRFVVWLRRGRTGTSRSRSDIVGNESKAISVRW